MIHSFADLRSEELKDLLPDLTLFIFAFGGLEQHGPHLPLGTKYWVAEDQAKRLAEMLQARMPNWNFILMPTLPISVDTVTSLVALPVRAHVVRDVVVDQANALKRLGFSKFLVWSAHQTPRQLSALEEAAKMISKRRALMVSVSSGEVTSAQVMDSPMIPHPKEHGGALDTGMMLSIRAHRVAKNYSNLEPVVTGRQNIGRLVAYFRHQVDGYWGKPAEAQPEETLKQNQEKLEKIAAQLQTVFETGQGASLFNSGYRFFFFNGSFFKAYLFGAVFFMLMAFWTLWSLKDVFEP